MSTTNHTHDCAHFGENFTSFDDALTEEGSIYELYTIAIDVKKYVLPILYILGVPGAILSFMIWTRPKMKHSSSVYLAALAIVDLSFFIANFLYYLSIIWKVPVLAVPIFCEFFSWIHYFFQIMSPCLTLGFTVERYVAIYYPYSAESCTISRAVKMVVIMSFINIIVSSPQAYFFQAQPERFFGGCDLRPSIIDHHTSLYKIYTVWSLASESVMFGVIPIVILIFNIRVIQVTRRLSRYLPGQSPRFKQEGGVDAANNPQQRQQVSANATTFMLLCVSFYLIFSTLPTTLCQLLVLRFYSGEECLTLKQFQTNTRWQNHLTYVNVKTIVEAFSVTHFAAKFYIYLATGRQFRKECKIMLRVNAKPPNDASLQTYGLQAMQNDCAARLLSNNHNKQAPIST